MSFEAPYDSESKKSEVQAQRAPKMFDNSNQFTSCTSLLLFSVPPGNLILFHKILVKDRTCQLSFIQVSKFRFQMFYTFSKNGRKTCKTLNNLVGGSSLLNLILPAISCCNVVMERNITRVQNCSDITIFLVFIFLTCCLFVFLSL